MSNSRVDVKAETTGRLVRFAKQEGDAVSAGEAVRLGGRGELPARRAAGGGGRAGGRSRPGEDPRAGGAQPSPSWSVRRTWSSSGGITDKDLKAAQLADRDAQAQVALAEAQLEQARAALEMAREASARRGDSWRPSRA